MVSKNCHVPQRAVVALMMFSACAIAYMMRVNMSINIIAMAKEPVKNKTESLPACVVVKMGNMTLIQEQMDENGEIAENDSDDDEEDERYDWDTPTQAFILGAYFWGQILSCAPGGLIAERFGSTKTIFTSTVCAGICTFLIPLGAMLHWGAVWFLRFITGVMGGVIYPALHCLVSRWAPPEEKGIFIGCLQGGSLGTVLTWPLLGILIEKFGWPCSFFVPAIIAVLWSLWWYFVVADSPQKCKRTTEVERTYLENAMKGVEKKGQVIPPYLQIFTSIPFWGFIIAHFGNSWGLFFLMTSGPKYMSSVLGFRLDSSGLLSSLPYLARMIFGFIFGFIGDLILRNKYMSTTALRKSFIICSHFIPGLLLLVLTLTECDIVMTVTLITMSLGVNGASSITNLANAQDLAPAFAGSLYGLANTVGGTSGFISPAVTGFITSDHNGIEEWRTIFIIGAAVYILSGMVFCFIGSGENQNFSLTSGKSTEKTIKAGIENTAFEKDEQKSATTQI